MARPRRRAGVRVLDLGKTCKGSGLTAGFLLLDGIFVALVTRRGWRSMARERVLPLLGRGVIGAFDAWFSFGHAD